MIIRANIYYTSADISYVHHLWLYEWIFFTRARTLVIYISISKCKIFFFMFVVRHSKSSSLFEIIYRLLWLNDKLAAPNQYNLDGMMGRTVRSNKKQMPIYSMTGRSKIGGFHEDLSKVFFKMFEFWCFEKLHHVIIVFFSRPPVLELMTKRTPANTRSDSPFTAWPAGMWCLVIRPRSPVLVLTAPSG